MKRMVHGLTKSSANAYLSLVYLFLYLPIIVLIVFSFNNARYSMIWRGFTWAWYQSLWNDSDLWIAASHSVLVGILAATLATFIGTLAAVSLYRYRFFGKQMIQGLIFVLILSPDIVLAIALLLLFTFLHIQLGFFSLLIAHITFCIPFSAMTVYGSIVSIDKNIFEAAKDLGAKEWIIFKRIIVPLLWPSLLASWLLSFTLSFDDVVISYFVAGPTFEILPLKIYSMARLGVKPDLNTLCSVIFCLTVCLIIISQLILRKRR